MTELERAKLLRQIYRIKLEEIDPFVADAKDRLERLERLRNVAAQRVERWSSRVAELENGGDPLS